MTPIASANTRPSIMRRKLFLHVDDVMVGAKLTVTNAIVIYIKWTMLGINSRSEYNNRVY